MTFRALALSVLAAVPAALFVAPSALAQTEDDVVINEFTVNPAAGKEYVELLVTAAGGVNMQGWTLSDVGTRTGTPGSTEGDLTLPAASYLASVPQGTFVVLVLTTPAANTNTIAQDTSTSDGNRRLVLVAGSTTGLVAAGTLDNATADNLQLYAGTRATGTVIDQVLVGSNTSLITPGATWGDNSSATTSDNINAPSTSVPSNSTVRFVPTADTLAEFQDNDTGSRFIVDANSYGTPGQRNAGVTSDTSVGGTGPGSTDPTGNGAASPATVEPGEETLLTVTVTPGSAPPSTGIAVTADLTQIGGSSSQPFFDDGTNGDATAGDNVFSYRATVAPGTSGGAKTLPVTITDAQGRTGSTSISLTVLAIVPIGTVQGAVSDATDGATHRSPFAPAPTNPANPCGTTSSGDTVAIQGVIYQKTLARTSAGGSQFGIFIQNTDETADANAETSDGIFVFMAGFADILRASGPGSYVPQVGDEVVMTGRVTEFFCLTQLSSPRLVRVVRTGAAVETEVPAMVADPPNDWESAERYWERREGMRVRVPLGSVVVGRRDVFRSTLDGEVWLMRPDHPVALRTDEYTRRVFRDPHPLDNNPTPVWDDGNGYRFMVASLGIKATANDNRALIAPARTYDRVTNAPAGGVYFSFSKYGIQVTDQLTLAQGIDPSLNAPPTAPVRPQEYSVADYNVENLYDFRDDPFDGCDFPGNSGCPGVSPPFDYVPSGQLEYEQRLREIAAQIVDDLHAPEILLIQEAEDQDICTVSGGSLACGTTNNADGRPDTLQELAIAIAARGGPAYQAAYDRDGADDRGIVAAFLYRTDRVELLAAPAGDPVLGASPRVSYRGTPLAYNTHMQNPKVLNAVLPADVDRSTGTDGSNVFTRAPQVGLFRIWEQPGRTGNSFDLYAVSNHFSSTPDARVGQRREQAAYNAAIAAAIEGERPGMRIVIGGDFNVYPRPDDPFPPGHPLHPSDQLGPLYQQGLVNLFDVLVAEVPQSAFSYVFQGQTQTLDQHFVSQSLRNELREIRAAHVNADYPADHDSPGARGLSDHDPSVAQFAAPVALADLGLTKTASSDTASPGSVLTYTIAVRNTGPSNAAAVTVIDRLPDNATLISATPSQGTCSGAPTVTCELGTLASGASARVVIDVRVNGEQPMTNTAETRASTQDPNGGNNSASVTTTVTPAARPALRDCDVTAAPGRVRAGRTSTVRVSVTVLSPTEPGANARVRLRGAGVSVMRTTDADGTARFRIRPRRAGTIHVTASGEQLAGCSARIGVRPAPRRGTGPALTGRP